MANFEDIKITEKKLDDYEAGYMCAMNNRNNAPEERLVPCGKSKRWLAGWVEALPDIKSMEVDIS